MHDETARGRPACAAAQSTQTQDPLPDLEADPLSPHLLLL